MSSERLVELLARRSARRGQFTLASGRQSSLYIDARLTTMHPEGLTLIGPLGLEALRESTWGKDVTAVGGLTLGADPIAYAISYASAVRGMVSPPVPKPVSKLVPTKVAEIVDPIGTRIRDTVGMGAEKPLRAFTVRKEPKTHGTGKLIEGPFEPGDRVAIIEDVITTGGSALKAAEAVHAAGGTVAGILALVDREEGGREAIEARGLSVIALVRAAEIVAKMG